MCEANLDKSKSVCKSVEGVDTIFPGPVPDVVGSLKGAVGYIGQCGTKRTTKPTTNSDDTSSPDKDTEKTTAAKKPKSTSTPKNTGTEANSHPLSPDGSCGATTGYACGDGACCGKYNFYGFSEGHCGEGCQSDYGACRNDKATGGGGAGGDVSVEKPCRGASGTLKPVEERGVVELAIVVGLLGFAGIWL